MDTSSIVAIIREYWWIPLIALIGIYTTVKMFQLLRICLMYTVVKWCLSKRKSLRRAGEWAVVTGASSGIGEAYAEELAKEGLNILLIGIDESQLISVSARIATDHHVETRIVVADFTQLEAYDTIKPAIQELSTIACLVNNVGMALPISAFVGGAQSPNEQAIRDIIHCNALSTVIMTQIVLPKMLTQKKPNPGIINVASYAGVVVFPYASMYAATKAFVKHFSACIAAEKYAKNIVVQTICPLFVSTKMTNDMPTSFFVPTAQVFVNNALDMFGVQQQTTGYIRHEIKAFLYSLLPTPLWILMVKVISNSVKSNRQQPQQRQQQHRK